VVVSSWLARADVRLFLTSAALLFVELLLIRWIPANVIYVGFFNNFVLLAASSGSARGSSSGVPAERRRSRPACRSSRSRR